MPPDPSPRPTHTPQERRVGHGWDRHRLEPLRPGTPAARPLIIGGVVLDASFGPVAHSDGDALAHALTDAVLGAAALGDIGQHFPDTDPAYAAADSLALLAAAVRLASDAGWAVVNADATLILERPKLGTHRPRIRENIARALAVTPERVNIKAKTAEGVDAAGRGEAIEAHAVILLEATGRRHE